MSDPIARRELEHIREEANSLHDLAHSGKRLDHAELADMIADLALMVRAVWPAFRQIGEQKHLLGRFLVACTAIGLFYAAGKFYVGVRHVF